MSPFRRIPRQHRTHRPTETVLRRLLTVASVICVLCAQARAAEITVKQLLEQQEQWASWAESGRKLQITGRYKGRAANRVSLQKVSLVFIPERGISIPDRLRPGTRLAMSGYFRQGTDRLEFRVTHLVVEPSDYEVMHKELQKLDEAQDDARYALADEFEKIAVFYEDRSLQSAIDECRQSTFAAQRKRFHRDPDALWKLVEPGPTFPIPESVQEEIRFQTFVLRARRPDPALAADLRRYLAGSEVPAPDIPETLLTAFEEDRLNAYSGADSMGRRQLERLAYRQLRLAELQSGMKSDGSNGLEVAEVTIRELPEEVDAAREMESEWADFRLKSTRELKRRELDQMISVLNSIDRTQDADRALAQWLNRQVEKFRDRGYEWQLRLADEFLHASTRWKNPDHRVQGILYLKRAWKAASKEAPDAVEEIEERLGHLDQYWLNNRWMTSEEIDQLPADSTARAARAGLVVRGMSMKQAEEIQGVPSRRVRMASSRHVDDVWIYGERGSSRLIIRLRRRISETDDAATVVEVRQLSGIR